MLDLKVVYVDGNSRLYCVPASLAGVQSLGVRGCNVSFGDHVRVVLGEDVMGEKREECALRIRSPRGPVPPLMELAAKTLHSHLTSQQHIFIFNQGVIIWSSF